MSMKPSGPYKEESEALLRAIAQEWWGEDDLEIDADAEIIPVVGGCWVAAWVFVEYDMPNETS